MTVRGLEDGLIMFDFVSAKAKDWVLRNGPWHINNCPLLLLPWEPGIKKLESDCSTPVWVKLSRVMLELMTQQGLGYIASGIGVPLCLEKTVSHISSGNSIKMCVEVVPQQDSPEFVEVMLASLWELDGSRRSRQLRL